MSEPTYETDWSPEALSRARELFVAQTKGGSVELSICVECGVWARWDSEISRYGQCFEGRPHRVSRVRVKVTNQEGENA